MRTAVYKTIIDLHTKPLAKKPNIGSGRLDIIYSIDGAVGSLKIRRLLLLMTIVSDALINNSKKKFIKYTTRSSMLQFI